jgi:hypothetical protein
MSVGDTQTAGRRLREVSPSDVAAASRREPGRADVRHFDQLRHEHQRAFLRLLRGESTDASLSAGVVIVFTDYYLVEAA